MKFSVFQGSRQGSRQYNQDKLAYAYTKDAILLVVADGMGGHRHGEIAAQIAVKMLVEAFQQSSNEKLRNPSEFLRTQIMRIHERIDSVRIAKNLPEGPRTTIVAAIVQNKYMYAAHVGDSRLYHFRDKQILYKTEDHSIVEKLRREGQLDEKSMRTHPERNKIYNCIGGDKPPDIALTQKYELWDGDSLMLCTDGVWGVLSDEKITQILLPGNVSETVPKLLNESEIAAGKEGDNMSVIALQWGDGKQNSKHAVSNPTMPLGLTKATMIDAAGLESTIQRSQTEAAHLLSDDDIEFAIAEIQAAINKSKKLN